MITFSFLNQTLWCDPHWNRLSETISMSGNIIGFDWEIRKVEFWKLSILDLICCPGVLSAIRPYCISPFIQIGLKHESIHTVLEACVTDTVHGIMEILIPDLHIYPISHWHGPCQRKGALIIIEHTRSLQFRPSK